MLKCNLFSLGRDQSQDQQHHEASGATGLLCHDAHGCGGGLRVRQGRHHRPGQGPGGAGRPEAQDEGEEVHGVAGQGQGQGPVRPVQHYVVSLRRNL